MSNVVSIHPYFKVREGELENAKALLPEFVKLTSNEDKCLYYDFTLNGDEIHCREAYVGGEGVLAHLENVGALLGRLLENHADLTRLELHGPADELDKVKTALADLNPTYFEFECGVDR